MGRSISDWAIEIHETARGLGWWPDDRLERVRSRNPEAVCALLALIHGEVSEAVEAVRSGDWEYRVCDEEGRSVAKPEGFPIELGDIVGRVLDLAVALGIDLETCLADKNRYNKTRPYRHGKVI